MKRIPTFLLAACALFSAFSFAASAPAAEASVTAILIHGSNSGGGVDGQLQRYERHLKRILPFDTFKQRGQGSTRVSLPGSGAIGIGGQRVAITVEDAGGERLRIGAKWTEGSRTLISTTVVSSRGQPTILGGPAADGGKLILLLIAN